MQFNSPHPDKDAALFGNIILQWSYVESLLLNILLRLTSPRFNFKAEPFPQALNRRIKLAKRGYIEIHAMAPLKDEALPLLESLWPMSERRNIIVHGYYQGFTGGSTYLFTTYRRDGDQGTFLFHHYSHEEVVSLAADIESARSSLEVLSKKTFLIRFPPLRK